MKKFVLIFLFFNIFIFSACAKKEGVILGEKTVRLAGQEWMVEIADTPAKWNQGLSGRESLAANAGMLFIYNDYNIRLFWMKEMKFPLDIVWIKDDEVVGCEQKVTVFDKDGYISQVESPSEVNYVLEINAGTCEKYNIISGTKIEIKN